jgi:tetraacyldisaccharide 4'-kinase
LALLTTEKDRARMTGDPRNEALAARVHVLPVRMEIREAGALRAAVLKAVQR